MRTGQIQKHSIGFSIQFSCESIFTNVAMIHLKRTENWTTWNVESIGKQWLNRINSLPIANRNLLFGAHFLRLLSTTFEQPSTLLNEILRTVTKSLSPCVSNSWRAIAHRCSWKSNVCKCPSGLIDRRNECDREPLPVPDSMTTLPGLISNWNRIMLISGV